MYTPRIINLNELNWTEIGAQMRRISHDAHEELWMVEDVWEHLLANPGMFVDDPEDDAEWPKDMPQYPPLDVVLAYYQLRDDWVSDERDPRDGGPRCLIQQLRYGLTPQPCINLWIGSEGFNETAHLRYTVVYMRRSDVETSDDVTLYEGTDEATAMRYCRAAEAVKDALAGKGMPREAFQIFRAMGMTR